MGVGVDGTRKKTKTLALRLRGIKPQNLLTFERGEILLAEFDFNGVQRRNCAAVNRCKFGEAETAEEEKEESWRGRPANRRLLNRRIVDRGARDLRDSALSQLGV